MLHSPPSPSFARVNRSLLLGDGLAVARLVVVAAAPGAGAG